jgi:hypothetical protein
VNPYDEEQLGFSKPNPTETLMEMGILLEESHTTMGSRTDFKPRPQIIKHKEGLYEASLKRKIASSGSNNKKPRVHNQQQQMEEEIVDDPVDS